MLYDRTYYEKQLYKNYAPYGSYQYPAKTKQDYLTEIKNLKREIEIAEEKIKKLGKVS